MYSNVKFYEKDNELHEVHFPVRLGGLQGKNTPVKIQILNFNEIQIILLIFTGSQDTDLIISNWEKCLITYFKS